jgi:hypothetical protein
MEIKKGLMQSDGMGMGGKLGMPRLLMLQAGAAYLPPQGRGRMLGVGMGQGRMCCTSTRRSLVIEGRTFIEISRVIGRC